MLYQKYHSYRDSVGFKRSMENAQEEYNRTYSKLIAGEGYMLCQEIDDIKSIIYACAISIRLSLLRDFENYGEVFEGKDDFANQVCHEVEQDLTNSLMYSILMEACISSDLSMRCFHFFKDFTFLRISQDAAKGVVAENISIPGFYHFATQPNGDLVYAINQFKR